MHRLTINPRTLKRSLFRGTGTVEIVSDRDAWGTLILSNRPFTPDVDGVAEVQLVAGTPSVKLGEGAFNLDVGLGASIDHYLQLVWPGDEATELAELQLQPSDLRLASDELYLYLSLAASGNASAKGNFTAPAGVRIGFGVAAGGDAEVGFLKRVPRTTSAKRAIAALAADLQLPQQVHDPSRIPDRGDVAVTRFGGYLDLSAGLTWGYAMNGSRSLSLRDLHLDMTHALKVAATATVGYRLAGEFEIQARRGADDDWVRFVVRKSSQSRFSFAADIGITGTLQLDGLPETADDFLVKLAGADARTVLDGLARARATSTIEALEAEVTTLGMGVLDRVATRWVDRALDTSSAAEFFVVAGQVVEQYESIDDRIIQLYESYVDRVPLLTSTLRALSALEDPDALRAFLNQRGVSTSREAWRIVETFWNERLFDVLSDQREFAAFRRFVRGANAFLSDEGTQAIRDYVAEAKRVLRLDPLLDSLRAIDTPDEVRALSDRVLRGGFEQLTGEVFDRLRTKADFTRALATLRHTLDRVETFRAAFGDALQQAATQRFNASLSYRYTRATSDQALIDVEIDLADPKGRRLAKRVSRGDFASVLKDGRLDAVRVNRGVLSHELGRSLHLELNFLGWELDRVVQVVQRATHAIEPQPGGVLHVFGSESVIEQRRTSGRSAKETVASTFLLKSVATTLHASGDRASLVDPQTRDYLVRTLQSLSVDYDLLQDDRDTTPSELLQYLRFAQFVGLVDDAKDMATQLVGEFPEGLGRVRARYEVRYDPMALQRVFQQDTDTLEAHARLLLRQFVAGRYIGQGTHTLARVAFAYGSPAAYDAYRRRELQTKVRRVTLPAWFTGRRQKTVPLSSGSVPLLRRLFVVEDDYVKRLRAIDQRIDEARRVDRDVPVGALNRSLRAFVEMGAKLEGIRDNLFFMVLDGLVHLEAGPRARRRTSMTLEITPPGAEEAVRKVLQSGSDV